jgi:hypothetical protein
MTGEIPGSFGLQNRTLLDTGTDNFKTVKLALSREKWDEWDHDYSASQRTVGDGTQQKARSTVRG